MMRTAIALTCVLVGAGACAASSGDVKGSGDRAGQASDQASHLVLSEIQTRGSAGGNDEFIEIYNPTASPIDVSDGTWVVSARSAVGTCTSDAEAARFTLHGTIPAYGHFLATGSHYDGGVAGDATFSSGVTDAASVVLRHGAEVVDAVCFSFNAATQSNLTSCATPYVCRGTPASNLPHDNTAHAGSNVDASLERGPGGASGNGDDTSDNATDFASNAAPTPQSTTSAPTPPPASSGSSGSSGSGGGSNGGGTYAFLPAGNVSFSTGQMVIGVFEHLDATTPECSSQRTGDAFASCTFAGTNPGAVTATCDIQVPETLLVSGGYCTYEAQVTFHDVIAQLTPAGLVTFDPSEDIWGQNGYVGQAKGHFALALTAGAPGTLNGNASVDWTQPAPTTTTTTYAPWRGVIELP
ncbi:MAG TPA: lamin tail domain-containing protein [Minicystis sp.]|nr:lamin tail domain-containing protein [Minicystis sp.]